MFKVMGDKVLLELLPNKVEKIGGIYVPEDARKAHRPYRAVVVALGPDCKEVRRGDMVYIGYYAGQWVVYNKKDYLLVFEGEIPALLIEEEGGELNVGHAY